MIIIVVTNCFAIFVITLARGGACSDCYDDDGSFCLNVAMKAVVASLCRPLPRTHQKGSSQDAT